MVRVDVADRQGVAEVHHGAVGPLFDVEVVRGDDLRAPRPEATARRRVSRRRHVARQRLDPPAVFGRGGSGNALQQRLRVGVFRRLEQLVCRAEFDHVAEVHHGDAVADVADDRKVVGDKEVRQPELRLEVVEQVQHLRLHGHVERRHRLVEHDEVRFERERAGDTDTLALAAGELVGVAVEVVRREADPLQQVGDLVAPPLAFRLAVGGLGNPVNLQRFGDDVADGHSRVETGKRVLEDDLGVPAERLEFVVVHLEDVRPVEGDRAAGRLAQSEQRLAGRGLPAPGLADEAERLAAFDLEGDAVDGLHARRVAPEEAVDERVLLEVVLLEVPNREERLSHRRSPLGRPHRPRRPNRRRPRGRTPVRRGRT
ncbi:hypothetical protein C454_10261 [Haloferax gibbonsii ATCC 33959]|uniref:Phenol hydroxylase n=1 Tax=Haloferax gibbonsii (strain ATCC 33959 / DSM 4427 / JCM 8863 / NBRC 102184 / NCIMB 2188 / Ma 2.38) TaxID=1227459 RepID=M0H819_HALGM|nr:hypothetical protein C454_10261 [Haloferax gibbonsii ATCC 33959]